MPITLTGYESHDGISEMVAVEVSDFADGAQVASVIDEADAVLRKIKGAVQRWKREEDLCYQVTGGMLRRDGGLKALDKVAKALKHLGYEKVIERRKVSRDGAVK